MTTNLHVDLERARELHRRAIVIDTHCDTTLRLASQHWDLADRHQDGHVDLPRLSEGGVDAAFFAVWAPGPMPPGIGIAAARQQIALIRDQAERHAAKIALCRSPQEVRAAKTARKFSLLIGIEGGYLIEDSLEILREYHKCGVSYLTITHGFHTTWADSAGIHEPLEPLHGGLTSFGREVIHELNRLGMMVDVSHVSDATFWDIMESSRAPVIATHSCCRAVCDHRRNLTDEMIRAIAKSGGTVQINFGSVFVDPSHPPTGPIRIDTTASGSGIVGSSDAKHETPLELLVDHVDHALQVVGPRHVGFGSDFDGVPAVPVGMEDCSKLPNLTTSLFGRGYSEDDLALVLGENVLRVMDACRQHASSLRGDDSNAYDSDGAEAS